MAKATAGPNDVPLYGGLAGMQVAEDQFDLGLGVFVARTYAHVFAPQLAAFQRPRPGEVHRPPWKALSGGSAYDIEAEIHIPLDVPLPAGFDRLNMLWFLVALLRLRSGAGICMPAVSELSFGSIASNPAEPQMWPVEMSRNLLIRSVEVPSISRVELSWLASVWRPASLMLAEGGRFNLAMQAFDQAPAARTYGLGILALWSALEAGFSYSAQELSFQIAASIACFLEVSGSARLDLFRSVKKRYNQRSRVAHGEEFGTVAEFAATYDLARRALLGILARQSIPTRDEFESSLFRFERVDPAQ